MDTSLVNCDIINYSDPIVISDIANEVSRYIVLCAATPETFCSNTLYKSKVRVP